MTNNKVLHILYTANLRGNIELLPRLHTFMRQLKSMPLDDENEVMLCALEPVQTRWLLLDLGQACEPTVWHCAATAGRSMLIALDAMGYQAANVDGMLTAESRARLRGNLMSMALVDAENAWQEGDVVVMSRGGLQTGRLQTGGLETRPYLQVELLPSSVTRIEGRTLRLAEVQAGQVGQALVSWAAGSPQLMSAAIHDLPTSALPDPTISGTVDFILGEARHFQGRMWS